MLFVVLCLVQSCVRAFIAQGIECSGLHAELTGTNCALWIAYVSIGMQEVELYKSYIKAETLLPF